MKPQLIKTGNGCKWCDGYGIMTLEYGPIKECPCVQCSPTRNLNDLLNERYKAVMAFERSKEMEEIDKHNQRTKGL